jgi:hypothetical protein
MGKSVKQHLIYPTFQVTTAQAFLNRKGYRGSLTFKVVLIPKRSGGNSLLKGRNSSKEFFRNT